MTLGSRSSPAITSAGSPGSNCCNEKIRIDTKNSVGDTRGYLRFSLQLQPDHAHQSVRHLLVALEPGGMRDQDPAVIDVQQRLLVERELRQFFVDRLALRLVGDKAGVIERLVGVWI